jgi:ABC-type oligopeptide transport system ATPase subunit
VTELLRVERLVKNFEMRANSGIRRTKRIVQAVSDVSFSLNKGETLGIVGESGSGKTTVGRCVMGLLEATSGSIEFDGKDITKLSFEEMRPLRRRLQIVFQDPFASLDPKMTVGSSIAEPLVVQGVGGDHEERVAEMLKLVGLAPDHAKRFPHEFSGVSANESESLARLHSIPTSSCLTSQSRLWTSASRLESSTSLRTSRNALACRTSSSLMTFRWCDISPTRLR